MKHIRNAKKIIYRTLKNAFLNRVDPNNGSSWSFKLVKRYDSNQREGVNEDLVTQPIRKTRKF